MEQVKTCCRCKTAKMITRFTKDSRRSDGRRSYCKECESAAKTAYRKENTDALRERNAAYLSTMEPGRKKVFNHHRYIKKRLRAYAGKEPAWRIAERLKLTESTVLSYAAKFGISLALIKNRWTTEDEINIACYKAMGYTNAQIGSIIGKSKEAVKQRFITISKRGLQHG